MLIVFATVPKWIPFVIAGVVALGWICSVLAFAACFIWMIKISRETDTCPCCSWMSDADDFYPNTKPAPPSAQPSLTN